MPPAEFNNLNSSGIEDSCSIEEELNTSVTYMTTDSSTNEDFQDVESTLQAADGTLSGPDGTVKAADSTLPGPKGTL